MRLLIINFDDKTLNYDGIMIDGRVVYAIDDIGQIIYNSSEGESHDDRVVPVRYNCVPVDQLGTINKKLQRANGPSSPEISTFDFVLNDFELIELCETMNLKLDNALIEVVIGTEYDSLSSILFANKIYRFSPFGIDYNTDNTITLNCDTSYLYKQIGNTIIGTNYENAKAEKVKDNVVNKKYVYINDPQYKGFRPDAIVNRDPTKTSSYPVIRNTFYYLNENPYLYNDWIYLKGDYAYKPYENKRLGFWIEIEIDKLDAKGSVFFEDATGIRYFSDCIGESFVVEVVEGQNVGDKYTTTLIHAATGMRMNKTIIRKPKPYCWYYFFEISGESAERFLKELDNDFSKSPLANDTIINIYKNITLYKLPNESYIDMLSDDTIILKNESGGLIDKTDFEIIKDAGDLYLRTKSVEQTIYKTFTPIEERKFKNNLLPEGDFNILTDNTLNELTYYSDEHCKNGDYVNNTYKQNIVIGIPDDYFEYIRANANEKLILLTRYYLEGNVPGAYPWIQSNFSGRAYVWFADHNLQPLEYNTDNTITKHGDIYIPPETHTSGLIQNVNEFNSKNINDPNNLLKDGKLEISDLEIDYDFIVEQGLKYIVLSFEQYYQDADNFKEDAFIKIAYINLIAKTTTNYDDVDTIYISRNTSTDTDTTIEDALLYTWIISKKSLSIFNDTTNVKEHMKISTLGYTDANNTYNIYENLINSSDLNVDIIDDIQSDLTTQNIFLYNNYAASITSADQLTPQPYYINNILNLNYYLNDETFLLTEFDILYKDSFGKDQTFSIFNSYLFNDINTIDWKNFIKTTNTIDFTYKQLANNIDSVFLLCSEIIKTTGKVSKKTFDFTNISFKNMSSEEIISELLYYILTLNFNGTTRKAIKATIPYNSDICLGTFIDNIKHKNLLFNKYWAQGFVDAITIDLQNLTEEINIGRVNVMYDSTNLPTLLFLDEELPTRLLIQEDISNTTNIIHGVL